MNSGVCKLTLAFQSITHALYHLAASPEYQQPIREEAEALISEEGWTKATMGKLWKLDSFLRESQRYNGISLSKNPLCLPIAPLVLLLMSLPSRPQPR